MSTYDPMSPFSATFGHDMNGVKFENKSYMHIWEVSLKMGESFLFIPGTVV